MLLSAITFAFISRIMSFYDRLIEDYFSSSPSPPEPERRDFYDRLVEDYFSSSPSPHEQEGAGDDDDEPMSPHSPPPILNRDNPQDFAGAPIKMNEYMRVPLSAEYNKLIKIYIKRAGMWKNFTMEEHITAFHLPGFVWQKQWALQDHLFRVIFVPREKNANHVLLLTALLGAIQQTISFITSLFKSYYNIRDPFSDDTHYGPQVYLKITVRWRLIQRTCS